MPSPESICAHCGRSTPSDRTLFWTSNERRRVFTGGGNGERPFRYVHEDRAQRICLQCYAELAGGARMGKVASRRGLAILVAAIVLGAAVAMLTPIAIPTLLSAFWSNWTVTAICMRATYMRGSRDPVREPDDSVTFEHR